MELNRALSIADGIKAALSPHCELINIAGSCRREKPEVKDIEFVCLPRRSMRMDLLSGEMIKLDRSKKFQDVVASFGKLLMGSIIEGREVRLGLPQGIKLELYMPFEHDYYRHYATRTGSGDYARFVIARGWNGIGWCGVDGNLRRYKDCIKVGDNWKCVNPNPELPPVWASEQEFFDWIKVRWVAPSLRTA